jgi:hypothetical protein
VSTRRLPRCISIVDTLTENGSGSSSLPVNVGSAHASGSTKNSQTRTILGPPRPESYFGVGTGVVPTVAPASAIHAQLSIRVVESRMPSPES